MPGSQGLGLRERLQQQGGLRARGASSVGLKEQGKKSLRAVSVTGSGVGQESHTRSLGLHVPVHPNEVTPTSSGVLWRNKKSWAHSKGSAKACPLLQPFSFVPAGVG